MRRPEDAHRSYLPVSSECGYSSQPEAHSSANAAATSGDLAHYTPGDYSYSFEVKGVRCGALICHDFRYPELFREVKRLGVQLLSPAVGCEVLPSAQEGNDTVRSVRSNHGNARYEGEM